MTGENLRVKLLRNVAERHGPGQNGKPLILLTILVWCSCLSRPHRGSSSLLYVALSTQERHAQPALVHGEVMDHDERVNRGLRRANAPVGLHVDKGLYGRLRLRVATAPRGGRH